MDSSVNSVDCGIVIPITRDEPNLRSIIARGLNSNFRLYVIHDIHDDRNKEILREIISNFSTDQVVYLEGYFGTPGAARNYGMKFVREKWIAFWDADDLPIAGCFASMVVAADSSKYDVAVGNFEMLDVETDTIVHKQDLTFSNDLTHKDFSRNPGLWRWAFRREKILDIDFPNLAMGEDQVFLYRIISKDLRTYKFYGPVYQYFINSQNQLTSSRKNYMKSHEAVSKLKNIEMPTRRLERAIGFSIRRIILASIKRKHFKSNLAAFALNEFTLFVKNFRVNSKETRTKSSFGDKIFLATTGGIGNQLFQIAAARSMFPERRLVLYPISTNPKYAVNELDFAASIEEGILEVLPSSKLRKLDKKLINSQYLCIENSNIWKPALHFLRLISNLFIRFRVGTSVKVIAPLDLGFAILPKIQPTKDVMLFGYFQSHQYFTNFPRTREFIEKILESSISCRHSNCEYSDSNKLVVQVRRGDYLKENEIGVLELEYFIRSIQFILREQDIMRISVYSDDIQSVLPQIKLYFPKAEEGSKNEGEPLSTLHEMRHGTHYLISNSTFGFWAAILSFEKNSRVYAPRKWFKSIDPPVALLPQNWHLLESNFID